MLNISGYSYLLCYRYQAKFNKSANFIKDQPKLLNIRTPICIFFYRNAFQSTDSEKKIRSSRIPRDLFETREGLLYGGVFLFLFLNSILWQKAPNNHRWGPSEGADTFIIVTYTLSHDRNDLVMPRLSRHFPRPPRDLPWNEKFIVVFMQKPAELKHNNFHSVLASENSAIYLWDLYKGSPDLSKVSNDPLIIQSSKVTSE